MAKRAVLVGVNRYLIPGADLRGCVNDVRNMQKTLVDLYGFRPRDLVILLDDNATKRNIQTAVRQMISASSKGDVALFHFSGHGSNVPDKDGDEADHRDEILCPHDLDWRAPLTDDWLRARHGDLDRLALAWNRYSYADWEDVEPPTRFSFRWNHPAGEEATPTNSLLVEFTLAPEGEHTRLRVTEGALGSIDRPDIDKEQYAEEHNHGWADFLGRLDRLLAERT